MTKHSKRSVMPEHGSPTTRGRELTGGSNFKYGALIHALAQHVNPSVPKQCTDCSAIVDSLYPEEHGHGNS
eukprot:2738795-Amphidinium_carterae.2